MEKTTRTEPELVIVRHKHISSKSYRLAHLYHVEGREVAVYLSRAQFNSLEKVKLAAKALGKSAKRIFETDYTLTTVDNVRPVAED